MKALTLVAFLVAGSAYGAEAPRSEVNKCFKAVSISPPWPSPSPNLDLI